MDHTIITPTGTASSQPDPVSSVVSAGSSETSSHGLDKLESHSNSNNGDSPSDTTNHDDSLVYLCNPLNLHQALKNLIIDHDNYPKTKFYKKFVHSIMAPNVVPDTPQLLDDEDVSTIAAHDDSAAPDHSTTANDADDSGTTTPEDIDIANPMDQTPQNFFMNLVTSSSVYAGLGKRFKGADDMDDDATEDSSSYAGDSKKGKFNLPVKKLHTHHSRHHSGNLLPTSVSNKLHNLYHAGNQKTSDSLGSTSSHTAPTLTHAKTSASISTTTSAASTTSTAASTVSAPATTTTTETIPTSTSTLNVKAGETEETETETPEPSFYDSKEDINSLNDNESENFVDVQSRFTKSTVDTSTLHESSLNESDEFNFEGNIGNTLLQKSVIKNLNNYIFDEGILSTKGESKFSESHARKIPQLKLRVADKLQKVFDIKDDDYFYGNITAWLVRNVLLQGHLYLTNDCLMYFAFLSRPNTLEPESSYTEFDDSIQVFQQGNLGMKSAKYGEAMFKSVATHRYWAILRLETLSIYSSATELYFPRVIIDLKTCIRAEIIDKEKIPNVQSPRSGTRSRRDSSDGTTSPRLRRRGTSSADLSDEEESEILVSLDQTLATTEDNPEQLQDGVWFRLVTDKKSYKFYADNYYTARHWCNNLTKLIFRLHNTNSAQEVLIKIPIQNITRLERKAIFIDPNDEDADAEDGADSLFIQYVANNENRNETGSQSDQKSSNEDTSTGVSLDHLCLVFFGESDRFLKKLSSVVDKHKDLSQHDAEEIKPQSKSEKFKSRFKKDHASENPQYAKTMSTLLPTTSNYIFEQILAVNAHITLPDNDIPGFSSPDANKHSSTLKKLGRSLTNPSKIFSGKKINDSTHNLLTNIPSILSLDSDSSTTLDKSSSQSVIFPRPLSLSGLKNFRMAFEMSIKDPTIAENLYFNDDDSYDEEANIQLSAPLGLKDPVELQKTSTIKSIGKSINVFSGLTKLFSSNPSHYYSEKPMDDYYVMDEEERASSEAHYIQHFSLNSNAKLIASYYVCLQRPVLPVYGKFYIGEEELCFRSLLPGVSTKMVLPISRVEIFSKARSIKLAYYGLRIRMKGAEELFLEFGSEAARDDCEDIGLTQLQILHNNEGWAPEPNNWGKNHEQEVIKLIEEEENSDDERGLEIAKRLAISGIEAARITLFEDKFHAASGMDVPIMMEDSPFFKTQIRAPSLHFVLLTIGSRGDVQPYISIGKELVKEGHRVTIATHIEFKEWIEKHGLGYKEVAGNPAELMKLMVSHGSMSVSFLKDAAANFKGWIVQLLHTSWNACQGADVLIESPSAMGGIHIAEALGIPYMRAFTMPWTRTRAYPHAFIVPDQKMGGSYNYLTHVMFETVFWKGISGAVNKWRVEELDLPKTNLFRMQQSKVPFIYNVAPSVLPPAVDFPDWISVTGYWFLEEGGAGFTPPEKLVQFLKKANDDKKRIVYIGFGSIVVKDAEAMTKAIVDAVLDVDVRCILNKGWSDRLSKGEGRPKVELPPEVYDSGSIPHDWLFPRIHCAVHHGGSGSTGASLRAGLPTIIKPFFGDQFFYATRIEDIGAGISIKKLNSKTLAKAIQTATTDVKIIERAKRISESIKKDNGVLRAIEEIYTNLEYARNLIATKQIYNENYRKHNPDFNVNSEPETPVNEVDDMYSDDLSSYSATTQ